VLTGTGGTATLKYDPLGRRIQKAFTQGSTTTTTNYVYDGDNSVQDVDQNGNLLARYAMTQNIDEPLAESRSGTTSYYEADGLGSVTSLSSSAGAIANTYTYDSFGKLTASTGSITNRFQYTAREFDNETGLYFYRARYYDPSMSRFLKEDPGQFSGGINFYNYTMNSPVGWTDPTGLGLSPEQCEKLFKSILKRVTLLEEKLGKYDPIADGAGGQPYSAGGQLGITKPGQHFITITGLQISILYDIKVYKDNCTNGPKIPCELYKPLTRRVPAPVFPKTLEEFRLEEESARYLERFWWDVAAGGLAVGAVLTAPVTGVGSLATQFAWAF